MTNINFVCNWFDSTDIRAPDLPQGKSALLPIRPPIMLPTEKGAICFFELLRVHEIQSTLTDYVEFLLEVMDVDGGGGVMGILCGKGKGQVGCMVGEIMSAERKSAKSLSDCV